MIEFTENVICPNCEKPMLATLTYDPMTLEPFTTEEDCECGCEFQMTPPPLLPNAFDVECEIITVY